MALSCIVCAACADDLTLSPLPVAPSPTVSHVSGARLRAVVLDAGTARVFVGWFDTNLGIRCSFQRAEDLSLRCLPDPGAPIAGNGPPLFVVVAGGDRCGIAPRAAYRATDAGFGVQTTCRGRFVVPRTEAADGDVHFPPALFVRAESTLEDRGDRLSVRVLVAEDGAREVEGLVDTATGDACLAYA